MSEETTPLENGAQSARPSLETLRQRAEQQLSSSGRGSDTSQTRLLHELKIHHIELELQNEDLQASRDELERSRLHYLDLFDRAPIAYFNLSRDAAILEANHAAAALFGQPVSRLRGRWFGDFLAAEHRPALVELLDHVFSSTSPPHSCEIRLVDKDRYVDLRASRVMGDDACRVAAIDVTARRHEIELRTRLAEEQAANLESLGRLAGGVAHEFNNQLTAILGNAEILEQTANLRPAAYGCLQDIQGAARICERLTRHLLGYARRQMTAPRVVDMSAAIAEMMPSLHNVVGSRSQLVWVPCTSLWPVHIDPQQLEEIVVSLVLQAANRLDGQGTIHIDVDNAIEPVGQGERVRLRVRDTALALSAHEVEHLFEPYFRGLDVEAGLGMSSVYGIVKQNGGELGVDSRPGQGTSLTVYLPRHHEAEVPPRLQGGTEVILIVEEDETVLNLCSTTLERLGYTVLAASSETEARERLGQSEKPVQLMLTSIGLQGDEALRILYTSAEDMSRFPGATRHARVLPKPFTQAQMARAVRRLLDERST